MIHIHYAYRMTGGRFERPIRKAYKVSIHKSYREDGKVKKKQWVIGTMEYYNIATNCYWIGDCVFSLSMDLAYYLLTPITLPHLFPSH